MGSSSTLATALTLPEPRTQSITEKNNGEQEVERLCTVKGCKSLMSALYEYKMCPSCRGRYRIYGQTKRAKWKAGREVFDREMASLMAIENERRQKGLENPEVLRAWKLSEIDEQIPTPIIAVQLDANEDNIQPHSAMDSPMMTTGVYPAKVGTIDTPHSILPYTPKDSAILNVDLDPLPARICTVSHCHRVLLDYYRFKRCEQHRLQNRYHKKVKRVRSKERKEATTNNDDHFGDEISQPIESKALKKPTSHTFTTESCRNPFNPTFPRQHSEDCRKNDGQRERLAELKMGDNEVTEQVNAGLNDALGNNPAFNSHVGTSHAVPLPASTDAVGDMIPPEPSTAVDVDADADGDFESDSESGDNNDNIININIGDMNKHHEPAPIPQPAEHKPDDMRWINLAANRPVFANELRLSATALPPDFTKGPTFNSISRTNREFSKAIPAQQSSFSRFRVELSSTEPLSRPVLMDSSSQGSSISNTAISLERSMDALGSRLNGGPTSVSVEGRILTATIPIPTLTVPTYTPFVYKPPPKNNARGTSTTKGKRKAENRLPAIPSTGSVSAPPALPQVTTPSAGPSASTPSNVRSTPPPAPTYGYAPSYPFYPYYMPPYGMPAYPPYCAPPTIETSSKSSKKGKGKSTSKNQASASEETTMATASGEPAPSVSGPGMYPFPYGPPPYGYQIPPNGYPYLPPQYAPVPGSSTSAHPYPIGPFPGYPFYPLPPPAASSVSVSVGAAPVPYIPRATSEVVVSEQGPGTTQTKEKDIQFSHYGHVVAPTTLPQKRKKRLKTDPHYLEKYRSSHHRNVVTEMASSIARDKPPSLPTPSSSSPSVIDDVTPVTNPFGTGSQSELLDSFTGSVTVHPCTMKSCQRSLPAESSARICDKCKLKLKKHQVKAKQRFKLEPRKFGAAK